MDADWYDFLAKDYLQGFPAFCGFQVDLVEHGRFETSLAVQPQHLQQDGFVHAGVMATMADHTAGYASYTTVTQAQRILTIEFKINYFQAAQGQRLVCRSRVIKPGKQIIVAESKVFALNNGAEEQVCQALVTLFAADAERLGGGK